jgi:integrase
VAAKAVRANGEDMATIRKRNDRWHCQVRKKGYEPQTKSFRTRAEADRWARLVESEMDGGGFVSRKEAESTTLLEVLDRYERENTSKKRGAVQERSNLAVFRRTSLAKRHLAAIRSGDVAELRDAWLADKLKPATVLRRLSLLSHVFKICRKEWHFESLANPVDDVGKPPADNARVRRIALAPTEQGSVTDEVEGERRVLADELQHLVEATSSVVLRDAIVFAVETAMRRGEIVSLKWADVDMHKKVAHLPSTKNGSSRDVPLSPRALQILERLSRTTNGRVFAVRADALTRAFQRSAERARVRYVARCAKEATNADPEFLVGIRFHDLRHEATSRLAAIFQMHELAKITGHRDPRMLMRYFHPRAEDLAKRFPELV